jgi:hypothetical protein
MGRRYRSTGRPEWAELIAQVIPLIKRESKSGPRPVGVVPLVYTQTWYDCVMKMAFE